jgi:hypothetical protein
MDSNAVLRPVGPRPPRVYWTRRLVLLAVLLVLIVAVAKACSGGSDKPTAASPRTTTSPAATPSPAPTGVLSCLRRDLTVSADTSASTYPAGTTPRLSAVVRNVADHPCKFRTSPGDRVWTIVSGADQVWSSADCTPKGSIAKSRLRPGKTIAYALVWNRHRSAKDCPTDTPEAPRGTYQLRVTINGVAADTVVFHLTD